MYNKELVTSIEVWWVLENELDPLIVVIKKMKEDI